MCQCACRPLRIATYVTVHVLSVGAFWAALAAARGYLVTHSVWRLPIACGGRYSALHSAAEHALSSLRWNHKEDWQFGIRMTFLKKCIFWIIKSLCKPCSQKALLQWRQPPLKVG